MKAEDKVMTLGYLEAEKVKAFEAGLEQGERNGRAEVIEWLERSENSWRNVYCLRFKVELDTWETQLKEWGVKQ